MKRGSSFSVKAPSLKLSVSPMELGAWMTWNLVHTGEYT